MTTVLQKISKKVPQSLLLIGAKREDALDLCKSLLGPTHLAKIDSGNHPDLHQYIPEGKSGLHPMANMQKLILETAFPPFEAKRKIFLIEEAEKMLPSSSNALLKTLEEPPEGSYFLLLSDQPDLLLPTILSRLYPISFKTEEIPALDVTPYLALAKKGAWDELLDLLPHLEEEDPKAVLHGFLKAEKDPIQFEKLSSKIFHAQKALQHNVKPRTVYLNLLLNISNNDIIFLETIIKGGKMASAVITERSSDVAISDTIKHSHEAYVSDPSAYDAKQKLKQEYAELRAQDEPKIPEHYLVAKRAENYLSRHRYPDVLPNEPTRVQFGEGKYFNANWVLERRAIACQGPRSGEIKEFWEMVDQTGVETIVSLANTTEGGRPKCADFWTAYQTHEETLFTNGKEKIVHRELMSPSGRKLVQYHLQNWPDHGVVSTKTLAELVRIVSTIEGKMLVHCSAGIGRTGTFCAAYEAFRTRSPNIFAIAKALRSPWTGRVGMIQTPDQYVLAHNTVQALLT